MRPVEGSAFPSAGFISRHKVRQEVKEPLIKSQKVIPAKAGIRKIKELDTGFRRCDGLFSVP